MSIDDEFLKSAIHRMLNIAKEDLFSASINKLIGILYQERTFIHCKSDDYDIRSVYNTLEYEDKPFIKKPIVLDSESLMLRRHWEADRIIKNKTLDLINSNKHLLNLSSISNIDVKRHLSKSNLLLIDGGPGSGKTTLIGNIIEELYNARLDLSILLSAPTAMAASRLADSVLKKSGKKLRASTIHSLLSYPKKRNAKLIIEDIIVLDEASMIGVELFAELFKSITTKTLVIIIGDRNQLPSIDIGCPYSDLLDIANNTPNFPRIELKGSHRFNEHSGIKSLADDVLEGRLESSYKDLEFNDSINPLDIIADIIDPLISLYHNSDPSFIAKNHSNIKILTGFKHGILGSDYINKLIIKALDKKDCIGLPIIVTKNLYNIGLYNGDIGIFIDSNNIGFYRDEEDPYIVSLDYISSYEFAFAITVHKAQGSEFERVDLVLSDEAHKFSRSWLYTAITRSKSVLKIWGHLSNMDIIINNNY